MTGALTGKSVFVADLNGAFGAAIVSAIEAAGGAAFAGCTRSKPAAGWPDKGERYDAACPAEWERILAAAEHRLGPLTSVVSNVDVLVRGSIEDLDPAGWRDARTMLDAAMLAMRHGLPRVRQIPGSAIVNVCSIASEIALPNHASYCAAAFALRPMTRSAAIHAREKGYATRINCVIAGFEEGAPLATLVPQAAVSADDVAAMVVYCLSDSSRGATGAEFTVDNGGSVYPT